MARRGSGHDIRIARERADLARARFQRRLRALQDRVSPAALKGDAGAAFLGRVESVKSAARHAVWRRPVLTGSIILGTATLIFWKPLKKASRRAVEIGRDVHNWHERYLAKQREAEQNDD